MKEENEMVEKNSINSKSQRIAAARQKPAAYPYENSIASARKTPLLTATAGFCYNTIIFFRGLS